MESKKEKNNHNLHQFLLATNLLPACYQLLATNNACYQLFPTFSTFSNFFQLFQIFPTFSIFPNFSQLFQLFPTFSNFSNFFNFFQLFPPFPTFSTFSNFFNFFQFFPTFPEKSLTFFFSRGPRKSRTQNFLFLFLCLDWSIKKKIFQKKLGIPKNLVSHYQSIYTWYEGSCAAAAALYMVEKKLWWKRSLVEELWVVEESFTFNLLFF